MEKVIFTIVDNGDLQPEAFASAQQAQDEINEYDDEDAYLMKIIPMTEAEFIGRLSLGTFYDSDVAQQIEEKIQEEPEPEKLYAEIGFAQDNWVGKMYAEHFRFCLVEGGYASDEEFHEIPLRTFAEFLNHLRKEIDFAEDYDKALAKYQ